MEGSEAILADFLSTVLELPIDEFEEVLVLNPLLPKESVRDKDFTVDIRIKTKLGKELS